MKIVICQTGGKVRQALCRCFFALYFTIWLLFLRLKLDRYVPRNSSVQYGQDLGLPDSPVRCLQKIAGGNNCVLILDQLDALRWTMTHSPTALAVCKELISEIEIANKYYNANISVMFVTRSFDYKCDARIRNLFDNNEKREGVWQEIEVDSLLESEVAEVLGGRYASLSKKLQTLLRNPASLYWVPFMLGITINVRYSMQLLNRVTQVPPCLLERRQH